MTPKPIKHACSRFSSNCLSRSLTMLASSRLPLADRRGGGADDGDGEVAESSTILSRFSSSSSVKTIFELTAKFSIVGKTPTDEEIPWISARPKGGAWVRMKGANLDCIVFTALYGLEQNKFLPVRNSRPRHPYLPLKSDDTLLKGGTLFPMTSLQACQSSKWLRAHHFLYSCIRPAQRL